MMTYSALGVQPEYIPAFTERARSIGSQGSFPLLIIKPGIDLAECIFGGEKKVFALDN
jgi:hypothetical protein